MTSGSDFYGFATFLLSDFTGQPTDSPDVDYGTCCVGAGGRDEQQRLPPRGARVSVPCGGDRWRMVRIEDVRSGREWGVR